MNLLASYYVHIQGQFKNKKNTQVHFSEKGQKQNVLIVLME